SSPVIDSSPLALPSNYRAVTAIQDEFFVSSRCLVRTARVRKLIPRLPARWLGRILRKHSGTSRFHRQKDGAAGGSYRGASMQLEPLVAVLMASLGISGPGSALATGNDVVIGDIDDLSGLYADIGGAGGVEAIKMAIADSGGAMLGRNVLVLVADHQNK